MLIQEFDETDTESRSVFHRLVNTETGETSPWRHYRNPIYFQGMVGATCYYMPKEGVFTPDEFLKVIGQ